MWQQQWQSYCGCGDGSSSSGSNNNSSMRPYGRVHGCQTLMISNDSRRGVVMMTKGLSAATMEEQQHNNQHKNNTMTNTTKQDRRC
jgi:hypothetical protein